jgi:two-component system chemotaxis response regulator CheB
MTQTTVFLVEDSPIALELLQRIFNSSPDIKVVGTARDGAEAIERIPAANPQVICTDLHMSPVNGLELTQHLMSEFPKPILIISNSVKTDDTNNVFDLLQAGALDIFPKPNSNDPTEYEKIKQRLFNKVKTISKVAVKAKQSNRKVTIDPRSGNDVVASPVFGTPSQRMIGIGSATGGPQAIQKILSQLPANFSSAILCIPCLSEGFLPGMISWLQGETKLRIKVAENGEPSLAGTVYFPPERHHLEVTSIGALKCSPLLPTEAYASIDKTFKSIAQVYGSNGTGIVLTGNGDDGAQGLVDIKATGGNTFAQNEQSCVIFEMPQAAIARGAVRAILSIDEIAAALIES